MLVLACLCACDREEQRTPPLKYRCYFPITTFDTHEAWQMSVSQVSQNIFAPLVSSHLDTRPQGLVAEDWRVDGTGRVWRFKIRPGLTFDSGAPVSPEAVLRNFRRILWLTRKDGLPLNSLLPELSRWESPEDPLHSVRVEGDSVVFEFSRRPVNLLETLCQPMYGIADPGCFDAQGRWKEPFCSSGSGQYRVASAAPGRIVLESRHLFPGSDAAPDSVEILTPLHPGDDALQAVRAGQGDLLFFVHSRLAPEMLEELRQRGLRMTDGPPVAMNLIQLNSDRPLFKGKALRQSFRDFFLRSLAADPRFTSQAAVDASFIPKGAMGYRPFTVPARPPLRKAAGRKVLVRFSEPKGQGVQRAVKDSLTRTLEAHGLEPEFYPNSSKMELRDYDVMRWTYGVFVNDPYADLRRIFMSDRGMALPVRSAALSRLIEQGEASADAGERQRLAERVNAWLFDDARLVTYQHTGLLYIHRPEVDLSRVNLFLDPIEFRALGWKP